MDAVTPAPVLVLAWWLACQALSLPGALVGAYLLPRCAPTGWAIGKVFGPLAIGAVLWLLASVRVVPFGPVAVAAAALAAWLGAAAVWRRRGARLTLAGGVRGVLGIEIAYLLALVLGVTVRSFDPGANSTEKPMDLMLFTAVQQGGFMPPEDPWMAGLGVSYYYLGFLVFALPGILVGIAPAVGYNLAFGSVVAASVVGVVGFALLVAARRPALVATLGIGLVLLAGNLLGLFELLRALRLAPAELLAWVDVKGLTTPGTGPPSLIATDFWWWWRGTRLIDTQRGGVSLDYTITEFPVFSFALGDLHPHVMAFPFLVAAVTVGAVLVMREVEAWPLRSRLPVAGALGVLSGAVAVANVWDAPTVLAVTLGACAAPALFRRGVWQAAVVGAPMAAVALAAAALVVVPFALTFSSQAAGLGWWLGPGTRPLHHLLFWGAMLTPAAAWLWVRSQPLEDWRPVLLLGPVALWLGVELSQLLGLEIWLQAVTARLWMLGPLIALIAIARIVLTRASLTDRVIWWLLLCGLGLQLLTEWVYVRDVFNTRMNTVFKLYYQTWALWGLAAVAIIGQWLTRRGELRALRVVAVATVVCGVIALYHGGATLWSRTVELGGPRGLDATAFLEELRPGEAGAIAWLRAQPRGRLLEAVGGSYTAFGRLSAASGVPTLMGWPGHERQWRGDDPRIGERERAVDQIYRAASLQEVLPLLERYEVRYVAVGELERQKYGAAALEKFSALPVGVRSGGTTIYRVP